MPVVGDVQWVEQVLDGDDQAFENLVVAYQDRIYNYLVRFLGSSEDASDTAQECFLRAYRSLNSYKTSMPFDTWLFSIAHNAACDMLRRRKVVEFVDLELCSEPRDQNPNPEQLCSLSEQLGYAQQALNSLKPEQREILVLRDQEEMTHDEISKIMDLKKGTVKSRLSRAREAIQKSYTRIVNSSHCKETQYAINE